MDVATSIDSLYDSADTQLSAIKVTGKLCHDTVDSNLLRASLNVKYTENAIVAFFDEELCIVVEGDSANDDAFGDALLNSGCGNGAGCRRHQAVGTALKVTSARTGNLQRDTLAVAELWTRYHWLNQRYELREATRCKAVLNHGALCD
jgi:hypothetical protein